MTVHATERKTTIIISDGYGLSLLFQVVWRWLHRTLAGQQTYNDIQYCRPSDNIIYR